MVERFQLNVNDEGSVDLNDCNKRESYGIYTSYGKFMGEDGPVSISNLKYFTSKLNEYYNENQALKNGNEYQKILLKKLDKFMDEWTFYYTHSNDKDLKKAYLEVLKMLNDIRDEFTGEEYE